MAVFLAWLGCSTLSGFGLPLFTKLCEQPEASVAWPLFEERFGVILSPPWCSLFRWTGMRLGMAWFGYCSPKCSIGRSVEFPWRVTSRVTHVTTFPREGTRCCIPLPCLWPACLRLLRQLSWWLFQQMPFYTFGYLPMMSRATWINRIGVVLHLLQVPVTQTAFPQSVQQETASRSLLGNHGYMSSPRRFENMVEIANMSQWKCIYAFNIHAFKG